VQPILNFLIIKFVLLENIVPTNEPPPGLPWGSLEGFLFLVLRVIPCAPVWMGLVFRWAFCFLFLFSFVFCLPMGHSPVFLCSNSPCPHCLQFLPLDVFQPSLYEPCIYLLNVQCMLGRCREIGRRVLLFLLFMPFVYMVKILRKQKAHLNTSPIHTGAHGLTLRTKKRNPSKDPQSSPDGGKRIHLIFLEFCFKKLLICLLH